MLRRYSTSLEEDLLKQFDRYIQQHKYGNRSEAIRDLIRKALIQDSWDAGEEVVGVVTVVYDHHEGQVLNKLIDLQHQYQELIVSTTHIHLSHDRCLEVVIVRGKASGVREMADRLTALRGVKSGSLTASKHLV